MERLSEIKDTGRDKEGFDLFKCKFPQMRKENKSKWVGKRNFLCSPHTSIFKHS